MKLNDSSTSPTYLRVADALREAIASGELAPGEQLPAGTKLAEQFGVALMTVRRAIDHLRSEGILRSTHGVGVFVATPGESPSLQDQVNELRARVEQLEQLAADKLGGAQAD